MIELRETVGIGRSGSATTNGCEAHSVTSCDAGKELTIAPSDSSDGTCADCSAGRFQSHTSSVAACVAWSTCPAGQGYMSGTGSATTDISCEECSSADYKYSTADDRSACGDHLECAAGEGSNWQNL